MMRTDHLKLRLLSLLSVMLLGISAGSGAADVSEQPVLVRGADVPPMGPSPAMEAPVGEPAVASDVVAPPPPKPERLREMIGLLRVARLSQELRLSEEDAARLAVRMRELTEAQQEMERLHHDLLPQIERTLRDNERNEKRSEERLRDLMEELHSGEARLRNEIEKRGERIRELLTLEQEARMLLFESRFDREVKEMIRLAREVEHPIPPARPNPRAVPGPRVNPNPKEGSGPPRTPAQPRTQQP